MKKTLYLLLFLPMLVNAQETKPNYGITFSGFVKNDFFYDSRQVVSIREGHFLLYPLGESLDADKRDINANPSLNFLSIQTRLTGKITGPDAFGAKTSGTIEADFFGNESAGLVDVNGFRLRHAIAKLNWEKTELLFGQYWHPMFIPGCFSGVISFNTGAPFQPFSRNPQMRFTYKMGNLNFMAAASMQRDFTNTSGSTGIRYSGMPDMHAQVYYNKKNEEAKTEFLAGAGFGFKILKPTLYTEVITSSSYYSIDTTTMTATYHPTVSKKYLTDQTVSGMMATVYAKYSTEKFIVKLQGVYGQNVSDLLMMGGYYAKEVIDTTRNTVSYIPTGTGAGWVEFQTRGEKVQFGLWFGYSTNLGASDSIVAIQSKIATAPARGATINSLYRVSPRVVFISGKFQFALETEYTTAGYATKNDLEDYNINAKGQVTESKDFSNLRVLFSTIYTF